MLFVICQTTVSSARFFRDQTRYCRFVEGNTARYHRPTDHCTALQHHLVKPIDLNKLDALIQEGAAAVATSSQQRPFN